ncbi:MAG: carboxylesterase family protein [Bacilli bacterium]|nr:carboxylesterase family protein [Bacilli bacterium]
MKHLKFTALIISSLSLSFLISCGNKHSFILDGIETIERSQEEWDEINAPATYTPNKEITDASSYPSEVKATCQNGTFVGKKSKSGVISWLGIPFAQQPVGELRFKKALPPIDSNKTFEAFNYMHYEVQPRFDDPEHAYDKKDMMGEDCLGLNIWSNPNSNLSKKPVFVYVHGGGWYVGSASNSLFRGELFTYYNPDIIYITVDYRTGMYGQLNVNLFDDGKIYPDAYNNGLLDVVESLRWIKKNIANFGGDPNNITLCGESAGGGAVSTICALDDVINEKLIQKAIPMSGNVTQAGDLETSTQELPKLLKTYFKTSELSTIASLDEDKLADFWLKYGNSFHNCIMQDGTLIKKDPYQTYEVGKNKDIIFLQGCTGNEAKYYQEIFGGEEAYNLLSSTLIARIVKLATEKGDTDFLAAFNEYKEAVNTLYPDEYETYNKMLCDYTLGGGNIYQAYQHTKNGGKDFVYIFDKSYMGSSAALGSAHAVDCNFLSGSFGYEDAPGTWENLVLSRKFQKMIANFCKSGDPSYEGVSWKAYDLENENIMYFANDATFSEVKNYQHDRYASYIKAMELDKTGSLKYVISEAYCYMVLQETYGKEYFPDLYPPYEVIL